eukprot:TRINITY_DN4479_c0_g1_i4.p1 TRINITY_DN4479_c0_g1~~TRINITY_DN4479_c0_g1_i4.p1  ORF type:complete len:303 (-),score=63.97 TRINITY_DN4479_c0_g1_i4:445-1353(-)
MTEVHKIELHVWAWIVAGIFGALAVLVSLWHIYQHWCKTHEASMLRFTVRILGMVPIYAIEAYIALTVARRKDLYITVMRECYEAWAVYSFWGLFDHLVTVSNHALIPQPHQWPMKYFLKPWSSEPQFRYNIKYGVFQYVLIRLVTAVATFILELLDAYNDGEFRVDAGYPWIALLVNLSQMYALYALVMFYLSIRAPLAHYNPGAKFLCIKVVVFVTFWQSVVISGLVYIGLNHQEDAHTDTQTHRHTHSHTHTHTDTHTNTHCTFLLKKTHGRHSRGNPPVTHLHGRGCCAQPAGVCNLH